MLESFLRNIDEVRDPSYEVPSKIGGPKGQTLLLVDAIYDKVAEEGFRKGVFQQIKYGNAYIRKTKSGHVQMRKMKCGHVLIRHLLVILSGRARAWARAQGDEPGLGPGRHFIKKTSPWDAD